MNKYLKLIVASIISTFGLYVAFKDESVDSIISNLYTVDLTSVIIASLLLIFSCIVRAFRWQLLLQPFQLIPINTVFGATMIGYFGNGVLAFRLGELLKAYSVSRGNKITMMQAFGTVILERILDLISVVLIFSIFSPWFPFDDRYIRIGAFAFSSGLMVIITIIFLSYQFRWLLKIKEKKLFSSKFGKKIYTTINRIFQGLTVITKTKHFFLIFISSLFLWIIYFIVSLILLNSCGIHLGIIGTSILLVLGSIAIGIPALPGSIGTYDAGIKYSLMTIFNIGNEEALNYAIISHTVSYFPFLIVGFIYFLFSNISLSDVNKIGD